MLNALFVTETIAKTGMVMLLGEVTSKAHVDYQQVVRDAIEKIGYTHSSQGLALIDLYQNTLEEKKCVRDDMFAISLWQTFTHVYPKRKPLILS